MYPSLPPLHSNSLFLFSTSPSLSFLHHIRFIFCLLIAKWFLLLYNEYIYTDTHTHTLDFVRFSKISRRFPFDFIIMFNLSVIFAVGRLFNLWVVFYHSQNGLHGTKLLSIVLLHISSTLSYLLCALNIDI
jgi:hypothetical protein